MKNKFFIILRKKDFLNIINTQKENDLIISKLEYSAQNKWLKQKTLKTTVRNAYHTYMIKNQFPNI